MGSTGENSPPQEHGRSGVCYSVTLAKLQHSGVSSDIKYVHLKLMQLREASYAY